MLLKKPMSTDLSSALSPLAYYQARLREGKLAYQYSLAADRPVFFPRLVCPFTGSSNLEWRVSQGLGTVHATTVVFPRQGDPYNVSLIEVDEGFRLMSRVDLLAPASVRIGLRVRLQVMELADDGPQPIFLPFDASAPGALS